MIVRMLPSVSLCGVRPEILAIMPIVHKVFQELEARDCVLTSARDGQHSYGSLHYAGQALDFDEPSWNGDEMRAAAEIIESRLSGEYDVVSEGSHIHIEWQPKGNTRT